MSLDEGALETAANGGMMEFDKWASMVEPLLERLEQIVYTTFPMPRAPTPPPFQFRQPILPLPTSSQNQESLSSSSNKENVYPTDLQTPPRPPATSTGETPASSERIPDSQPQSLSGPTGDTLPEPLRVLLNSIKSIMRSYFSSKPPHTIQRLSELILRPNAHYRTLPAYLRAIDRVVCVTSNAGIFPLQMQASSNQPNGVTNGDHAADSDEYLGGALLTPIPWLTNSDSFDDEMIATSLSEGLVPTQAPVSSIPAHHHQHLQQDVDTAEATATIHPQTTTTATAADNEVAADPTSPSSETSDELPHARGPPVVGVEDMGLQDGKGVEMQLSNTEDVSEDQSAGQTSGESSSTDKGNADGDGDILLGDATNRSEEPKTEQESAAAAGSGAANPSEEPSQKDEEKDG